MAEKKRKKWIQAAVPKSHEGKFTAKAEVAGKGVQEYAREKAGAGGTLGHEAQFALNMKHMAGKRKRLRDIYKKKG